MEAHILLPVVVLVSAFVLKNAGAHSTLESTPFEAHAHCPCQCRIEQNALKEVYNECHSYSYEQCKIAFCLVQDRPGLSCCNEDMSGTALDGINAALEGVRTTAESYLFDEYHTSESAEAYLVDDYDGSETAEPYLVHEDHGSHSPYLELSYEDHENAFSSAEPCGHLPMSPSVTVSPIVTPTPTPTASVTASATPTRTPSTSPSPTTTPSVSPSPSPKFATLHYAADNEAFVYVNGVLISALTDWRLFETISFPLRRNDVVAILARDNGGWYGLIAALHVGDRWFVTGRDEWKAIKAFEFPGDDELWTVPFFDTCSWDLVEARPNADVIFNGKAPDFPYETGAQYVWADDAGENDSIFVRFVLGGEDCS